MTLSLSPVAERPSPNHDARPPGTAVDMLLLHYTGMPDAESALARMCDRAAKVSAHYMIDEDGSISRLVDETRRAWHAGAACWRGRRDVNAVSLGIEIVNPGHEHGYRTFPEAQTRALEALCREIVSRHPIPARHVLAHSDVAPGRRADPGEFFDWGRLAAAGIGLWPASGLKVDRAAPVLRRGDSGARVAEIQEALARFGYCLPRHGTLDPETETVIMAFQRHFRPARLDGHIDGETAQLALQLAASAA